MTEIEKLINNVNMTPVYSFVDIGRVKDLSIIKGFVTDYQVEMFQIRNRWDDEVGAYHVKMRRLGGPFQWEYWLDKDARLFVVKEPRDLEVAHDA